MIHKPVLVKEVIEYLDPKPNENFVDCTIGEGGHTAAILDKIKPNGRVLGIEWDAEIYEMTKSRIAERLILVNDSYVNLKKIIEENNFNPVNGILLDLGMSTEQLLQSGRGFTFLKDEPLDMRYNAKIPNPNDQIPNLTAEKIVNEWPREEIEKILKEYGEEKFARKIAEKIIEQRKLKIIKTTFELVEIIKKAVPLKYQHGKISCATRTFQALRIAVNGELENIKNVLPDAISVLAKGGRLVVISFHSLEDRLVKNFFKEQSNFKILTKKPVMAKNEEASLNPASRSAKLRAIIKL